MIQSDNSESNYMNIKNILAKTRDFTLNRVIELFGFSVILFSIFIALSMATYAPEDPNFIFKETVKINNIMGFRGSYISDFIFQSFGLISYLVPLTFFFNGLRIVKLKQILIIIENFFYTVLYIIFGSLFFSLFYNESFQLMINGNGGFVGAYLVDTSLINLLNLNKDFSFYILVLIIIFLFLISVNFKISVVISVFNYIVKNSKLKVKNSENLIRENEANYFEKVNSNLIETRIQENLPFNRLSKINESKFKIPKLDILNLPKKGERNQKQENLIDESFLEKILLDFGVQGKIKKINYGPVVTLNEFEPAAGVKVSKIINLSEDIARNTSSESARISTIPGRSTIGIELPNQIRESVYLREILSNQNFGNKDFNLPIALGKSISGIPVIGDLSSMPHLLIAGTTGSGKSVCINTIILSLLYKHNPQKCKFILIDPKMLELSTYEGIPHLLCPVITEAKKAASVLGWVVKEMESRYKLMTREGVRNIDSYNSKHKKLPMPYIVVIVDEMADLMHVAGKEIEGYIQKLSQMARASGIHIIMATQRPSVDVITGTIKANFPTRISFQVTSKIDSRTILGEQGAEQLLGKGDMLYMSSANRIVRIHAPFVSDEEIEKVNSFIRSQAEPDYIDEILNFADEKELSFEKNDNEKDELYSEALELIKNEGKASTSFLQRKLQIGYNRAARIIDMMEDRGEVSKANHVGKREVLK